MLAPKYQLLQPGTTYDWQPRLCSTHHFRPGSINLVLSLSFGYRIITYPIYVLFDTHYHLANTDGLPGPAIIKKFGKPAVPRPK